MAEQNVQHEVEDDEIMLESTNVQEEPLGEENIWDEVPDDSKPVFKDDQTLMKPETVILSAPKIFG